MSPDIASTATGSFRLPSEDGDAAEQTMARDLPAASDPLDHPKVTRSNEVLHADSE